MRSFTLNDLLIHDITQSDGLGYWVHTPVEGLDFPEVRFGSQDKPSEHGATPTSQLYGARIVTINGGVFGSSILSHYERRRALQAAARIIKNNYISQPVLSKFTTDDGLDLQFYAHIQMFKNPEQYLTKSEFHATLNASDPRLYSQTAKTGSLAIGTGSVTNNGDDNTFPVLTFNGPLTNPILTMTDLSESFKLNVVIAGGHFVVVDMAAKTVLYDGVTNYNAYWDANNIWLSFIPGVNPLTLAVSSGSGNMGYSFRDAYVGS